MNKKPSIVFIVGTGRCGSSLIHEMVSRNESTGFISNIDDRLAFLKPKGRFNNALFQSVLGNFTRKGGLRFAPSEAYRLIAREVSPSYAYSCRDLHPGDVTPDLKARFQRFFQDRISSQKKPVFLHKYTGWSRIGFFREIFPEAKFIHIIRDGRAVANSLLQTPWWDGYKGPENWLYGALDEPYSSEWRRSGKSFITLAGITWKMLMESYEESRRGLGADQFLQIRYEDFVEQPREYIHKMLDFSNLEWNSSFEKQFARQKISLSRKAAYREDLSQDQLIELEKSIASTLVNYGYTPVYPSKGTPYIIRARS